MGHHLSNMYCRSTLVASLVALVAACPAAPKEAPPVGPSKAADGAGPDVDVITRGNDAADGGGACSTRQATLPGCAPSDGCVWDSSRQCRDVANACEATALKTENYSFDPAPVSTAHGRATFKQGDPCALVDKQCAYDPRMALCEPFTVVSACPATAALARETSVLCGHPDQPQLECSYPEGRGVTFYCGVPYRFPTGVDPGPGYNDIPRQWIELADYDDRGCPTSQTSQRAACKAPATLECSTGLSVLQCVHGKWKRTRMMAPPP